MLNRRQWGTAKVFRPLGRQESSAAPLGDHFQLNEKFRRDGSMLAFLSCFAGGAARWQTVKNPIRSNAYEITARQMWVIT
jgi:hypothetical protein